ncbi:MAG: glycosyltransferase [Clostridium sp.]|nr:glycosyltransferase [Clostridium sp.]
MYSTADWLQQALVLCVRFSEMEAKEREAQFGELEKIYHAFSQDEQESICDMLRSQLDNQTFIYVHSILIKYLTAPEFKDAILDCMLQMDYNWYWGSMMEWQVIVNIKTCYEKKRLLHKKNVDKYNITLGSIDYGFLPLEKRNKRKIIIMTGQLLSVLHAPTKMVLDFAYILQERLDYELLIFVCPCDGGLPDGYWQDGSRENARKEFEKMPMRLEYKDAIFHGYQVNMSAINIKEYYMMLELIHAWNPLFVFNVGMENPVADLAGEFTTVAAMEVSLACPVSEAQILVRLGRLEEMEEEYERVTVRNGQTQIFMEEKMPVLIDKSPNTYIRTEFEMPEDKFLIAIVGNRLDTEIDLEFIQTMKHILDDNEEAVFVVIGDVERLKDYFFEASYQSRIFYLGYCTDLMGIYSMMDFYMNPKRGGGGFSSQMALVAGIPVVTLPDCDVAYHAGDEFIVETYSAMESRVSACMNDKAYYAELKKLAGKKAESNTETKMVQYVEAMLEKINDCMEANISKS